MLCICSGELVTFDSFLLVLLFADVAAEHTRGAKLTELMTHHIFTHDYRLKVFPIVNSERVSDELRDDRAAARPRLDRFV